MPIFWIFNASNIVVRCHNVKKGRKPVKLQKENPAGCAEEGKQSKGNYVKRKGRFKDNLEYTRIMIAIPSLWYI